MRLDINWNTENQFFLNQKLKSCDKKRGKGGRGGGRSCFLLFFSFLSFIFSSASPIPFPTCKLANWQHWPPLSPKGERGATKTNHPTPFVTNSKTLSLWVSKTLNSLRTVSLHSNVCSLVCLGILVYFF